MWLLPLLVIGALAVVAASRSPRERIPASHQIAAEIMPPGIPGPIAVVGEMLRSGQYPPPPVILCAIAEAEAIGRQDLASDIINAFVAPVVRAHERKTGHCFVDRPTHERGRGSFSRGHERGSCALPTS